MTVYDISQEVFSCCVYDGDSRPELTEVFRTEKGDLYNLSDFSMCAHNGTHIDAPFHFINDGDTVDRISLDKCVGYCYVTEVKGNLAACDVKQIIEKAKSCGNGCASRILLKGNVTVTDGAASAFAQNGILLIGVESQSVGDEKSPMSVHKILLDRKVVLLEGIRLSAIKEGRYFLCAAPISLGGCDGAPCRALLIEGI